MNYYTQYQDKLRVSNGILGIDKEPIETDKGWYLIPGFSRYRISKNYTLLDTFNGDIIYPSSRLNDYPVVQVGYDADRMKKKQCDFHRLVALAFIPVPTEEYGERIEVDHIDGTRTNFKVENLEWVTKTTNYKRGRVLSKKKSNGIIYRVVNRFNGNDSLVRTLDEACNLASISKDIASDHIKRSGRYSNTAGWTIIEINTTTNSGYRNPIYVWDYTDGSRFICKSFTDAMDLTGVSKSSIDKSLKSSLLDNCPYIKGYKFFRVGETPEKMAKMTELEALYWVFVRIYYSASNLNTPGYIVYDEIANKAYPALSLDDVKNRFLPALPENKISALVQLGSDYRGIKVYQIYQRDGSRLLGVEPTQSFKAFELAFNGKMVLCNDTVA